jgi:hypothetical protein
MVKDDKKTAKTAKTTKTSEKKIEEMNPSPVQPEIYDLIGQRLRNYYDEVAKQPVPERFTDLLNQLEAKTASKKLS